MIDSQGIALDTVGLLASDGETIAEATLIPNGWMVGEYLQRNLETGTTTKFYRPSVSGADISTISHAELSAAIMPLSFAQVNGFGDDIQSWQQVQSGVERNVTIDRHIDEGAMVHERMENNQFITRSATDATGKILWYEDQLGHTTSFSYDALGRVVGVVFPGGEKHTLGFDAYGRPERIHREGVMTIEYAYDAITGLTNEKSFSSAEGGLERVVMREYDQIGRTVEETHRLAESGESRRFHYDYDGKIEGEAVIPGQLGAVSRVVGDGFERRMIYDAKQQLWHRTHFMSDWRTVVEENDYYEDGSLLRKSVLVQDEDGQNLQRIDLEYVNDKWGRLFALMVDGAELFRLVYDDEGKVERADFTSGESLAFYYDQVTRNPSGYSEKTGSWSGGVTWQLDERGFIANETFSFNDKTWYREHSYEERGFLETSLDEEQTASYTYSINGLPETIGDLKGERALPRTGSTLKAGGEEYEYDDLGRVVRKGQLTLEYGPTGEIDQARNGNRQWSYIYDEAGNRLLKLENGAPIAAYVAGGYLDKSGFILPIRLAGRIVGIIENGQFEILATDPRGTLLGEEGVASLPTPYGVRISRSDLFAALDYVEKGYDADLGTIRMGVRDYDPYISQFWTADPLFLEVLDKCVEDPVNCNLYSYARNNPINFTDRTGLWFGFDDAVTGPIDELVVFGLLYIGATVGFKPAQDALDQVSRFLDKVVEERLRSSSQRTTGDITAPNRNKPETFIDISIDVQTDDQGNPDHVLYRAMREQNGMPEIGPSARSLGVRPNVDIPVENGMVKPGTGGMSVAPYSPLNLPRHRRPPEYGGIGKDPVWEISLEQLTDRRLIYHQDSPTHGMIEPAMEMTLEDYEQALAETESSWQQLQ